MHATHFTPALCALIALALPACGSGSSDSPSQSTGGTGGSGSPDGGAGTDGATADSGAPDGNNSDANPDGPLGDADSSTDGVAEAETLRPLVGIYAVAGNDARWGAYSGQAEVRMGGAVVHLHQWTTADFEGDQVALAWQGTAEGEQLEQGPYPMSFTLDRVGFIKSYGGESHEGLDPAVVSYSAQCTRSAPAELQCTFTPDVATESEYTETWTWVSDSGADPVWENQRTTVDMHDPIPDSTKATMFSTYATFQALPEVQPYVNRPEFQEAMHRQVFDPTDYDFYQANPHVLRAIQKVPDKIGLVETRMRARAYGQTLEQKRDYYEAQMPTHFLNEAGMLVSYAAGAPAGQQFISSGDSMLWTGVYAASQAMRALSTGEQTAVDNMLAALHAQFLCWDIAGEPGQFARTIRAHQDPLDGWNQGTAPYEAWDWMPGCNNDMLQGYYISFTWAWKVFQQFPGYDTEKQKMVQILSDLLDNFSVAADKKGNELKGRMLLYAMTGDLTEKVKYEAFFEGYKTWLIDQGNGALWEYGTSDWSGNHLIIQGLLVPYLLSEINDDGHLDDMKTGLRNSLERMRHTRLGLYQLIGAALGDFSSPPPEIEENLWVLKEFPAPKINYSFDWRINPSFCMSPFPSLPWKNDWTTSDRLDSLNAYPLFEKVPDVFAWKQGPFGFRGSEVTYEDPGADYLFAYWFGRYTGIIPAQ